MAEVTVVFADLTGSVGVFELLGNAKATQAITRLTQWIGTVCNTWNGRVVKTMPGYPIRAEMVHWFAVMVGDAETP